MRMLLTGFEPFGGRGVNVSAQLVELIDELPTSESEVVKAILPVDWHEVTRGASTATNYQMMPGDRLFIAENKYSRASVVVSNFLGPYERAFGFVSLATSTLNRIVRFGLGNTF